MNTSIGKSFFFLWTKKTNTLKKKHATIWNFQNFMIHDYSINIFHVFSFKKEKKTISNIDFIK